MKLTAKKAIELSIELWTWLGETGKEKWEWPKWGCKGGEYPEVQSDCFLCEYDEQKQNDCVACPYCIKYGDCDDVGQPFIRWANAETKTTRKKYAKQFLEQLKTLLEEAQ